jgi:phosphate-induced protein 1
MKKLVTLIALCALTAMTIAAQTTKTNSKMLYHDGPVLHFGQNAYVIWYGDWPGGTIANSKAMQVVDEFIATVGNTPYMTINSTYSDASGPATAGLIFAGEVIDSSYSHTSILTAADIAAIISDQILSFRLPQDPQGIYIVIGSADISSNDTGFCIPGAPPYHASSMINGGMANYIFLGHPNRCPSLAGPWFSTNGPTPHDTYPGDVLAANLAHALNATFTDPHGNAWFDRYGLENADKCVDAFGQPTFGQTYVTANGARANLHLGVAGDYLLPQNWVNGRRGYCAMLPQ